MIRVTPAIVFRDRRKWVTKFVIDGKEYGGNYDALNDQRIDWFFCCFPTAQTILELGSLEGGHTIALARHANVKRVLGVEARPANIERAKMVKELFGAATVDFVQADLDGAELVRLGRFDAVFCVGVLYHLLKPWKLIEQLSRITRNLFIWTHYSHKTDKTFDGFKGAKFRESGLSDPLSGLSPQSFWPTLDSLCEILRQYGFGNVQIVADDPNHEHAPAVTLAATMDESLRFPSLRLHLTANPSCTFPFARKSKSIITRMIQQVRYRSIE